ncbi:MAG: prolyl oligopeptidase family serine peptidase, partial [Sphingobacterium sp.]
YKEDYYINYWLGNNEEFYISRSSRDLKRIDLLKVNVNGAVNPIIQERSNVYLDVQKPLLTENGKRLVHWSERDGWGHYYHYDTNGKLINQITKGSFHCEEITGIDPTTQTLFFTASGREKNEDPYYLHHYSVNLNGNGIKLLNAGNFDHQIEMSESSKYFVNNSSRVNTTPESVLLNSNGQKVMTLEKADLSLLFAAGYKFPEPFKVKAGDGTTDLYGVMYKPFDFDSTRTYPIVEYVYPGPQTEAVNKSFGRSMDRIDRLAQFGFIVVTVGNRGGHPSRSQWYHTYGYGNLRDYGLEDKKVTAEQLADRYKFIDVNRVGITGHSGGGFMSTAAMLVYPDFFKVAVSGAGNHENQIYNRWWSERHHGVTEKVSAKGDTTFSYQINKNTELAKNLKGRLLIATGDIDNNVHPANSIRMVDALIKANKRFDFLLLPGQRHGFGDMTEYFFWKMGDYFSQYLLGDSKMNEVDMTEMNREKPQK